MSSKRQTGTEEKKENREQIRREFTKKTARQQFESSVCVTHPSENLILYSSKDVHFPLSHSEFDYRCNTTPTRRCHDHGCNNNRYNSAWLLGWQRGGSTYRAGFHVVGLEKVITFVANTVHVHEWKCFRLQSRHVRAHNSVSLSSSVRPEGAWHTGIRLASLL